jgi:hypothetical protein
VTVEVRKREYRDADEARLTLRGRLDDLSEEGAAVHVALELQ